MQNEKYLELDALAAPNGYVAPPTKEDLAYEWNPFFEQFYRKTGFFLSSKP